jgi:DNA polymerase-3 subunit delta
MPALDFDAFRKSVMKGEILPAYYLHGDEELLKDDGLRDLLAAAIDPSTRDFNCDRRRAADLSADEFQTLALTPPMMATRRAVVITEAEALQQRRQRLQDLRSAIARYLEHPSGDTMVVLVQSAGEKPDPAFEKLTASVAIKPLTPDKLEKWIRHRAKLEGVELEDAGARHLKEAVGDDLPQLAAEIAKLGSAVRGRTVTADDVADLVGVRRGETVHAFVDAVTGRQFGAAAGMVRHLLESPGNSGVRLVTALATSLTGLAWARALLDRGGAPGSVVNELQSAMFQIRPWGLRGYAEEARRWAKDAALWTMAEADAALAELLRADKRLKGTTLGGEIEIVTEALLGMAGA